MLDSGKGVPVNQKQSQGAWYNAGSQKESKNKSFQT